MPLAPLHVEYAWSAHRNEDVFETRVGPHGRTYNLNFLDLMNLIASRNGRYQPRLRYYNR